MNDKEKRDFDDVNPSDDQNTTTNRKKKKDNSDQWETITGENVPDNEGLQDINEG